jgi:hypothetical protein
MSITIQESDEEDAGENAALVPAAQGSHDHLSLLALQGRCRALEPSVYELMQPSDLVKCTLLRDELIARQQSELACVWR